MTILLVFSFVSCDNTGNGNSSGESVATSEEKKKFEETYGNWEGQALELTALDKGLGTEWIKDAARTFNKGTGSKIAVKADEQLNDRLATVVPMDGCSDIYFSFSAELQWIEWALAGNIEPLDDISDYISYRTEQYAKLGVYDGLPPLRLALLPSFTATRLKVPLLSESFPPFCAVTMASLVSLSLTVNSASLPSTVT